MPAVSPKAILLVGPAPPYRGGIAHFLKATASGLAARGHRVEVANFSRQYPELLFPGKTQYETEQQDLSFPSTRMLDSINPLSWRKTAQYIIAKQPDVVVFKHWMPFFAPAYGSIARRLQSKGIHTLCIVHNALPHESRPGDKLLSRYFFKACDGFVVMSSSVAEDLKKLGAKGEIKKIRHPVYEDFGDPVASAEARERLGLDSRQPVLLFFGFVRKYKGLQVLLESMPAVLNAIPDARLIVAGECYEDEQQYRDFVEGNNLKKNVQLRFEYISNKDIPDLFSAADVIVQPYISATQSGVAQIAFHFERPLIVTDVGGLAEIVPHEKAGLVVPPQDPQALAAAVIRFFEEQLHEPLRQGVLHEKEKYSWDHLYEAIEDFAG